MTLPGRAADGARSAFCGSVMHCIDPDRCAWCEIDGSLIVLDIVADRYFRLTEARSREAIDALGGPGPGSGGQPSGLARPPEWMLPVRQSPAVSEGPFRLSDVAHALWVQRRVERRLAAFPFSQVLFELHQVIAARRARETGSCDAANRIIRAFEHSRLLRSAADRCLPRSIAMALCLAARGVTAQLVIGVKLAPFGAHSWVQWRDEVLNDQVEEVLRYRPILII